MKKTVLLLMAAWVVHSVSAQRAFWESKTTDEWFVGVNAGVDMKVTGSNWMNFNNYNPMGTLRIGRNFSPLLGVAIEGSAMFKDKGYNASKNVVKAVDMNLMGLINFSNLILGYKGSPRKFEVIGIAGAGVKHDFVGSDEKGNWLTAKLGADLAYNFGHSKEFQAYLEPSIYYRLETPEMLMFNINRAAGQLFVGINYKFGNSYRAHNFKQAKLYDQIEVDQLNEKLNELRLESELKDRQIARNGRRIAELEDSLAKSANVQPTTTIVRQVVNKVVNNVLQPTVIFGVGKTTVDAAQMASVAMIAKYMKNHPDSKILIKGYASPEGDPEANQRLSENRAASVMNVLVNRYGISQGRLMIQGMGATDELFDELDFNRVATFTDITK